MNRNWLREELSIGRCARRIANAASRSFLLSLAAILLFAPAAISAPLDEPIFMREGKEVRGPTGYYELCRREPWSCPAPPPSAAGADVKVVLDDEGVATLAELNAMLNSAYKPSTDYDLYGVSEYWTTPIHGADCEDYVIAKRSALVAAGWPPSALLIGVARGVEAPYHAVLLVRTDRGELVLDNLRDEVLDWRETGYDWVVRQSLSNPQAWVRVLSDPTAEGDRPALGSLITESRPATR